MEPAMQLANICRAFSTATLIGSTLLSAPAAQAQQPATTQPVVVQEPSVPRLVDAPPPAAVPRFPEGLEPQSAALAREKFLIDAQSTLAHSIKDLCDTQYGPPQLCG